MEFEYWWLLLLAVFFGLGWLAARVDIKHLLSESRELPASYFRGLNFLLNEQPDKAIEAFLEVTRTDQQTTELHFALGGLFRRRGEVERAIRMHQGLVERSDLSPEQRAQAVFELGQDYHRAGMLDRAEQLFLKLVDSAHARQALRFLSDIYVTEKDWQKAINISADLAKHSAEPLHKEVANYYCELAAGEYGHSRPGAAREYLDRALAANRKCIRANLLLGDWAATEGKHDEAIEYWKRIEAQNPQYLFLVADRFLDSYRALGKPSEALTLLRGYQERYPAMGLLDAAFQATLELESAEAALRLAREDLRRNPTLPGLDKFIDAQLIEATPERRQDLQLVKNLVHAHGNRFAYFQCENCGFKARQFHWHCPACANWESFPPRRYVEREVGALAA